MGRQKRPAREESDESAYSEEEHDGEAEKTDTHYRENVLVATPSLLNKTFDSCEEFNSQFAAFCKRTHQYFYKRTSTTRQQRNTKIEARYAKTGSETPASEPFENLEFPLNLVSYLCTHAGEPRDRGSGKRPRRNVRPVGCKAKLHVLQRREGDRYFLVVSVHHTEHNHRVRKTEYEQITRHRMRLNSRELAEVSTLRWVGVARKKILKYIWENTDSEPCMVDDHNLLAKLKKEEEADSTVSERLSETLNQFGNRRSMASLMWALAGLTTRQSPGASFCMRSLFSSFPETILVDATHGTNAERYRLFSFMAHDSVGHGQHVQVSPFSQDGDAVLDALCL
ncbi:hypothetical protein PF004_g1525 [Phytophthora fragariae]|uniref:ZSWIM1/3 RNaseH-like domain-containing protein n=1 Tax=Phytophthora fragariae TaxID=53985 RepID=A0A6G0PS50_9STRA|nr:hypothetical protein PF004_g1525 [Phytophthora fragariae]